MWLMALQIVIILYLFYNYLDLQLSMFMPEDISDKSCHGLSDEEHYFVVHVIYHIYHVFSMV